MEQEPRRGPQPPLAAPHRLSRCGALLASLAAGVILVSHAEDWPHYRGPNYDGISRENIRTNWSVEPPRQVWKVPLSPALSSFTVSGGRAFSQGRRAVAGRPREFCIALDAATGQELWAFELGEAVYDGGVGSDDGPRSTPSVEGSRVYVLSSYLRLACLDAATGAQIWSRDLVAEFSANLIPWQNAASPLLAGDLVLLNTNGRTGERFVAFRKTDGTVAWKGQNDALTHATPTLATIEGIPQAIFFTQSGLVALEPETGAVLWRYAIRYNGTSVAASPVVAGNRIYCSRAYAPNSGATVVQVTPSSSGWSATKFWGLTNQLRNHWATPVHHQGHLYGMFGQDVLTFECIELATGQKKWSVSGFGYGGVIRVGEVLLAMSATGQLVLVAPTPVQYTEIGRYTELKGKSWNIPVVANGRIYARSTTNGICLDVALAPPPLTVQATRTQSRSLQIRVGTEGGRPLEMAEAEKIQLFGSTNAPFASWMNLQLPFTFTNGVLLFEDTIEPQPARRFYRAGQTP